MKSTLFLSSLGSLLGVAAASHAHHMHHDAHEALLERALAAESTSAANATDGNALCGCTTQIMTYFGEPMLVHDEATTTTIHSTAYTTVTIPGSSVATNEASSVTTSSSVAAVAPAYTSVPAASSSEAAASYSAPASTSAPEATSYAAVPTSSVIVVPPSSSVYSAPATSSTSTSATGFTTNGNLWGMTYSPYTNSSTCKDSATMTSDVAAIKAMGFTTVRIYSTDCDGLSVIGDAARSNGLKMILGVYISESGTADAQEQVDDIVSWAQWDLVELISVGNEAIFNEWVSADALAAFISSSKSSFASAGYTGLVTTTETVGTWQDEGSPLCDVVDILGANIHPFFGGVLPEDSSTFISDQLALVEAVCSGKTAYNLEVGWPTAGECNGDSCPGYTEQASALANMLASVGSQCLFFSFQNELWKSAGEYDVEQSWGCGQWFMDN